MTKNRFSIFMLVLLGLYLGLRLTSGDGILARVEDRARNVFGASPQTENKTNLNSSDQTFSQTENQAQKKTDEEFTNWVQVQTKNLEVPTNDPIEFERKTKEFVNQLNPTQLAQLKDKILNIELPMNERIFSNYAMMQFEGETKNEYLKDLLSSPIPQFPDPKPHSEDEVRRGQEYALRYMEIDELFRRSEDGNGQAHEILSQIAQNHPDSKIQNYAKRKLSEIRK
jgi:hypothetical protein